VVWREVAIGSADESLFLTENHRLRWFLPATRAKFRASREYFERKQSKLISLQYTYHKFQSFYLCRRPWFPQQQTQELIGVEPGGYSWAEDPGPTFGSEEWSHAHKNGAQSNAVWRLKEMVRQDFIPLRLLDDRLNEVQALTFLRHPNIVKLCSKAFTESTLWLVTEARGLWSLHSELSNRGKSGGLPPRECRVHMAELIDAVAYMHHAGFCHRDLKPNNIAWMEEAGRHWCVIQEFHVTQRCRTGERLKRACGTVPFASPQILRRKVYDGFKNDVWGLGILAMQMLLGPNAVNKAMGIVGSDKSMPSDEVATLVESFCSDSDRVRAVLASCRNPVCAELAHFITAALQLPEIARPSSWDLLEQFGWLTGAISGIPLHRVAPPTAVGGDSSTAVSPVAPRLWRRRLLRPMDFDWELQEFPMDMADED